MSEEIPQETHQPHADGSRRNKLLVTVAKTLFMLVASAGVWQVIWFCFVSRGLRSDVLAWGQNFLLPLLTLGLLCIVATRHHMHWTRPLRQLGKLLPMIRSGECPIEELAAVRGPGEIQQLIPAIEALFRDLRQQRTELAELNEEMRQRIAQRTDALERKVGSLRHQASRDPLTSLGNRRMLDLALPELIESCAAAQSDLAILMIDVDNFKTLNDTLGHPVGDQLLRDIGRLIHSSIRHSDQAYRVGGDEFVVVMPDATEEQANSLQQRLVMLVDSHARTLRVDPRPRLSIGLVRLNELAAAGATAIHQSLVAEADRRLYEVKAQRKTSRRTESPVKSD